MDPKAGDTATAIGQTFGPAELVSVRMGGTCWMVDATVETEFGTVTLSNARMCPDEATARQALGPMGADASVLYYGAEE